MNGDRFPIIDAHCHVGEGFGMRLLPDDLLQAMDANGVERAVICPMDRFIAVENEAGNDYVASLVRVHPDRFIGFATVNPWYGEEGVAELEGCGASSSIRRFRDSCSTAISSILWSRRLARGTCPSSSTPERL